MTSEAITLLTLTHDDHRFYPLIGPLLGNRDVHKQLGGPPYDDPRKIWIAAVDGDGQVVGVIGLRTLLKGTVTLESNYISPGHDEVRHTLVEAATAAVHPTPCVTTVRHDVAATYRAHGFTDLHPVGKNYVHLARKPS